MKSCKPKLNAADGRVLFMHPVTRIVVVTILSVIAVACNRNSTAAATEPAQQTNAAPTWQPNAAELDPPAKATAAPKVDGKHAYQLAKDFVALGKRPLGSEGHKKAEEFITSSLKAAGVTVEYDQFTADTPVGKFPVNNIIGKIAGSKDGVIVVAGHYDTNYPLKDVNFVGANDGGSDVGLMLDLASVLQKQKGSAKTIDGYSVWFVFTDAEEAMVSWTDADSVYGSRHLAQKWQQDGTNRKVKAFLLLDMIGDKDLDVIRDSNSTPWLEDVVYRASQRLGTQSHFYAASNGIEDDHLPFAKTGIPVADIIDLDYGFNNVFHHTTEDTMDKISPQSLQIIGDVVLETFRALNTH